MSLALAPSVEPRRPVAIGYARISSDDQRQGLGVERQTEDIKAACKRHGWDLSEVITDNDFSASKYARKKRPGFKRVMATLRAGSANRLVVYNLDRFSRIPRELEDLIDVVETTPGLLITTVNGTLDLRTREGQAFARMQVMMSANEVHATHDRLIRHYDQVAAQGRPKGVGRARAFGYEADGMTIRDEEAAALRAAANDILNGASLADIVRRWNGEGRASPQTRGVFRSGTVKDILTNPRHAGWRVHRGQVVGPAAWPPILSDETHRALVAKLNDPSRRVGPRGKRSAFAGLLRSTEGRVLERSVDSQARGGKPKYSTRPHYPGEGKVMLSVTVNAEFVERHVLDLFFEAVESGRLAERVAQRRKAKPAATATDDPVAIERELETLAAMKGAGDLTMAEWQAARAPLTARLKAAQKAREVDPASLGDRVLDDLTDLRERWETFTPDRQRAYLSAAFDRIIIHKPAKQGRVAAKDPARVEPVWKV